MNKVSKRLLALALSLTMVAGLVPASLAADETGAASTPSISLEFTAAKDENDAKLTIKTESASTDTYEVKYKNEVYSQDSIEVTETGVYTVELWTKAVEGSDSVEAVEAKKVDSASKTIVKLTFTDGLAKDDKDHTDDTEVLYDAGATIPNEGLVAKDAYSRTGYKFTGWKGIAATVPNNDTTYTAIWEPLPEWTVTLSSQTSGKLAALTFNAENAETVDLSKLVAEAYLGDEEAETITFELPKDTKVASITDNTLTATGFGSTTLTITVAEKEGVARETVKTVPVHVAKAERTVSVTATKSESDFYVGDTNELTVKVEPALGEGETVTFDVVPAAAGSVAKTTDNKYVFTAKAVAENGVKVTAKVAESTNYNAATSEAAELPAIKANAFKQTVTISGVPETTVAFGMEAFTLTATSTIEGTPAEGEEKPEAPTTFTWSSSDETVAIVNNGTVTITGNGEVTIKAAAAGVSGKYAAAEGTVTLNVAKQKVVVASVTCSGKNYDGTNVATVTVTFKAEGAAEDATALDIDAKNYTVVATYASADVVMGEAAGDSPATEAEQVVTYTVTFNDDSNYQLTGTLPECKAAIKKIDADNVTKTAAVTVKGNKEAAVEGSIDLAALVADVKGAKLSYKSATDSNSILVEEGTDSKYKATVDGTVVSFKLAENATANTATILVTVSSTNYKDYDITVTVTATDKDVPVLELGTLTKTYDGVAYVNSAIPGTAKVGTTTVTGDFAWPKDGAPKDVKDSGLVEVTFTPADTTKYIAVTGLVKVTINQAKVAATVKFPTITEAEKNLADVKVEGAAEGMAIEITNNTTPETELVFAWDDTTEGLKIEENKSYAYTISAKDDTNGNFEALKGTVVLWGKASSKPSGSGSSWLGNITSTTTDSKTGAVTETSTKPDGTKVAVTTETDGTVTTTETYTDGTVAATTVKDGAITSTVTVPASVDKVTLTIPTPEAATAGMVAVIVKADGTEEIVKTSIPGENGVALTLTESAELKIVDNSKDFVDLAEDHWAAASIDFVTAREIFNGTGDGNFSPAANTTRASLMTILARLNGVDTEGGATWYEKGMAWAVENGVSDGTDPDGNITREQLVTMLYRYVGEPETTTNLSAFNDAEAVSDWAVSAMTWAVSNGIVTGKDNSMLDPTGLATRAEVATMLERYVKLTAKA